MIEIVPIERLELGFEPRPWPFATARRGEIEAHFAALRRSNPALWNGRTLMLYQHAIRGSVFHGTYLETDYASFAAWRHWGRPVAGVRDCFGAAAVATAEGAFLLGVMGPHTVNSGQIYFPCGTPDPKDVVGGKIDLDLSVARELTEETGLNITEFEAEPGWTMVVDGPLIAQIKVLHSNERAVALRERIRAHLASERHPELADIRIVGKSTDIDSMMPRFVTAFLAPRLSGG